MDAARSCYSQPNSCQSAELFTDVLQVGRACNHLAWIARNRAQVVVDCPQVAVGHFPERRPSHDLEKIAVEGWLKTISRNAGGSAIGMYVI
jgi:hypothetical protein